MVHDRFLYEPVRHVWTAESWQPQRHRTVVPPLQTSVPNHGSTIVREAFFSLAGISWNSWHYPRKYVLPPYRKCLPTSVRA